MRQADHLSPDEVDDVHRLATAAGDADGAYPLSEHVMLHLRHGGDAPAVHLLIRHGAELVGYAHVDTTDVVDGASAELVVHPMFRRHGLGRALVTAVTDAAASRPDGRLRLWAHGDHPSATALALSLGFDRHRVLFQLRRSLFAPVAPPHLPDGVDASRVRAGRDDEAWVRVNARAFAGHPDQGKWTIDDLRVRMTEPWFDPAGFLLATARRGVARLPLDEGARVPAQRPPAGRRSRARPRPDRRGVRARRRPGCARASASAPRSPRPGCATCAGAGSTR